MYKENVIFFYFHKALQMLYISTIMRFTVDKCGGFLHFVLSEKLYELIFFFFVMFMAFPKNSHTQISKGI